MHVIKAGVTLLSHLHRFSSVFWWRPVKSCCPWECSAPNSCGRSTREIRFVHLLKRVNPKTRNLRGMGILRNMLCPSSGKWLIIYRFIFSILFIINIINKIQYAPIILVNQLGFVSLKLAAQLLDLHPHQSQFSFALAANLCNCKDAHNSFVMRVQHWCDDWGEWHQFISLNLNNRISLYDVLNKPLQNIPLPLICVWCSYRLEMNVVNKIKQGTVVVFQQLPKLEVVYYLDFYNILSLTYIMGR